MVRTMWSGSIWLSVEVSLGGMEKDWHLTETCPTDPKATVTWNIEDKRILPLLVNSVDRQIQSIITQYKKVKESRDFLKFIYGKSDNLNRIYALLQEIFHPNRINES